MRKLTTTDLEDLDRTLKIIETLKRQSLSKLDPNTMCTTCGRKAIEKSSYCSGGPHICPICFYVPYIEGYYVGCICEGPLTC